MGVIQRSCLAYLIPAIPTTSAELSKVFWKKRTLADNTLTPNIWRLLVPLSLKPANRASFISLPSHFLSVPPKIAFLPVFCHYLRNLASGPWIAVPIFLEQRSLKGPIFIRKTILPAAPFIVACLFLCHFYWLSSRHRYTRPAKKTKQSCQPCEKLAFLIGQPAKK